MRAEGVVSPNTKTHLQGALGGLCRLSVFLFAALQQAALHDAQMAVFFAGRPLWCRPIPPVGAKVELCSHFELICGDMGD